MEKTEQQILHLNGFSCASVTAFGVAGGNGSVTVIDSADCDMVSSWFFIWRVKSQFLENARVQMIHLKGFSRR